MALTRSTKGHGFTSIESDINRTFHDKIRNKVIIIITFSIL